MGYPELGVAVVAVRLRSCPGDWKAGSIGRPAHVACSCHPADMARGGEKAR